MSVKNIPTFSFEKKVWKNGNKYVGGADEVGRGCLAGPVVCGCVVFPKGFSKKNIPEGIRIDDSKKLTNLQRQKAAKWITRNSLAWGIGSGSVIEINRLGIVRATSSGFRRAIAYVNRRLGLKIQFLLVDALYIPYVKGLAMPRNSYKLANKKARNAKSIIISAGQLAIINGDEKSISIAAASIIAKVYRDKLMEHLATENKYKEYGWEKNKGYGTKVHLAALKKFGPTKLHRKKFIANICTKGS